jgi:hypothetical protein
MTGKSLGEFCDCVVSKGNNTDEYLENLSQLIIELCMAIRISIHKFESAKIMATNLFLYSKELSDDLTRFRTSVNDIDVETYRNSLRKKLNKLLDRIQDFDKQFGWNEFDQWIKHQASSHFSDFIKSISCLNDMVNSEDRKKTTQTFSKEYKTQTSSRFTNPMSETSKYIINAEIVQIVETNSGEVIAKKYANDPAFTDALTEIVQILTTLQQKYPTATETEAEEIIEAEFTEIKTQQPKKWETFRRQLLNRERWFNGGKAALSETAKHYLENNVFSKAGIAFLEGFSADED